MTVLPSKIFIIILWWWKEQKQKTCFQIYFLLFNWLVLRTWGVLGRYFYKVLARKNKDGGKFENLDGQSLIEGHLMDKVLLLNILIYWRGRGEEGKCPQFCPPVPLRFRWPWEKNHRLNDTWPVLPHSPPNVTVIMYFVFLSCHYMCSWSMFS